MSENVVACLIDVLMVIIAERNNATITLDLNSSNKSEWIELHGAILSGEATKNKLQEVGKGDLNIFWSAVTEVIATMDLFGGKDNANGHLKIDDIIAEVSSLPQHCNRLLGAYFSTLEVLIMIGTEKASHDAKNLLLKHAIATVQHSLFPNRINDSFEHIECLFREYRNISPYCYVFNRKNGIFPESYSEEICEYVDSILINETTNVAPLQSLTKSGSISHYNDDESSIIDTMVPQLTTPSIAPLRPFNFDELNTEVKPQTQLKGKSTNIDNDFQFANDMAYSTGEPMNINNLEDSIDIHSIDIPSAQASPENSLQSQQMFSGKQKVSINLSEDNNDMLSVSMNESSILDAYLNNDYKAWEMDAIHSMNTNIPVEEDEDSDGDQNFQASRGNNISGPIMYGALSIAKKASQTRMRSPSAGDPVSGNRRFNVASKAQGTKRGNKFVKGKGSTLTASATIPRVTAIEGSSDEAEFSASSSLKKASSVPDSNSTQANKGKKEKALRFASQDEYETDTRPHTDLHSEKSDDNSIEEILDAGVDVNMPKNYDLGFGRHVNQTSESRWNSDRHNTNSNGRGKAAYLLSESESSVDLSDMEKHPDENIYTERIHHGFASSQSINKEDRKFKVPSDTINGTLNSQIKARNPLDLSLETLPQNDAVMEFYLIDEDDGSHYNTSLKPVISKASWGSRGNVLDESDNEDEVEIKPKPAVWKSVKSVTVKRSVIVNTDDIETTEELTKTDIQRLHLERTTDFKDTGVEVNSKEPGSDATDVEQPNSENKVPIERESPLLFDINDVGTADIGNIQISPLPAQRHAQAPKITSTHATPIPRNQSPHSVLTNRTDATPIAVEVEVERHLNESERQLAIEKLKASILLKKKQSVSAKSPAATEISEDVAVVITSNSRPEQDLQQLSSGSVSDSMSSLILLPAAPPLPTHEPQSLPPPAVVSSVQFEHGILDTAQQKQNQQKSSDTQDEKDKARLTSSISGGGGSGPPPRPKSILAQQRSSIALTSSLQSNAGLGDMFHLLPDHYEPPPLSEFAEQCGVIVEGFLNKKSAVTGLWQQRYFVLSESSTQFCVLRIFGKAVVSKWGLLPLEQKRTIPIQLIERVDTITAKGSKGREFSIKWQISPPVSSGSRPSSLTRKSFSFTGVQRNSASFSSVGADDSAGKTTHLQAQDAETRLLWVTMLNRAVNAFLLQMD